MKNLRSFYSPILLSVIAVAACVSVLGARSASAWGAGGHQEVADIAWTRLTPAVKLKIAAILAGGDGFTQPDSSKEEDVRHAFLHAATFPDEIKNDFDTIYEPLIPVENMVFPMALGTSEGEAVRCKTWHYYDTPIRYKGDKPGINTSNALVALTRAEDKLTTLAKAGTDLKMEAWYLAWIVHVVGDLHQPLHCTSSYEFESTGDAGGNLFPIMAAAGGRSTNLHSLWDGGIDHAAGARISVKNVETISDLWTKDAAIQPSDAEAKNLDIASWIATGADLAEKDCYTGIKKDETPTNAYLANEDAVCKKQALLAGYRLAAILNHILGS